MHKPKVLVLTSSFDFVYELATKLTNEYEIFFLAPAQRGSLSFEISDDIKIYRHKQFFINNIDLAYGNGIYENLNKNKLKYLMLPFYFFFQILMLKKIIKQEKIKVVHAHWILPNALIAVLCKKIFRSDFKILATIHGSDFWGFNNKTGNLLKKYALKNIDSLTVVSNAIKKSLIENGYKKEVYVYPMGLDTTLFSPTKRDQKLREDLKMKGLFLLFVGRIVEQKGIRLLIQSMPTVIKEFPDAKLVVIGDGNLRNGMEELTRELKIAENVIFTGSLSHAELPRYFASADLFIMPSFSEGFGLVIIEAMSCKTIAVTTNLEVVHDIISDNKTGFFFEKISKQAIAEKITYILQNKKNFENIREKGRQSVIEKFDWDIVRNNYSGLINKLII